MKIVMKMIKMNDFMSQQTILIMYINHLVWSNTLKCVTALRPLNNVPVIR